MVWCARAYECLCGQREAFCEGREIDGWNETCDAAMVEWACGAVDDERSTSVAYARAQCCEPFEHHCTAKSPSFADASMKTGTSGRWIGVNAAMIVVFAALFLYFLRCYGWDPPVRTDGVAPTYDVALVAACCRPQGLCASLYLAVGVALMVVYGESDRDVRVSIAAAAAHLLAFVLLAVYPGCCGTRTECSTASSLRVVASSGAYACCAWASCCTLGGLLFHSSWVLYFFCCVPCFVCVDLARCLAFKSPLRKRDAYDRPPALSPVEPRPYFHHLDAPPPRATRVPHFIASLLPAVSVAYAYADLEDVHPTTGDCELAVVAAQPEPATRRDLRALPSAAEVVA